MGQQRDPGGAVSVCCSNPRWERRLVKFLELSRVRRTMADGTNEGEAWAERMDRWIVWETRGEGHVGGGGLSDTLFFFFSFSSMLRGTYTPSSAHSAPMRTEDLFCSE
jgi:hypothetical protein